jgi:hypothetical protein
MVFPPFPCSRQPKRFSIEHNLAIPFRPTSANAGCARVLGLTHLLKATRQPHRIAICAPRRNYRAPPQLDSTWLQSIRLQNLWPYDLPLGKLDYHMVGKRAFISLCGFGGYFSLVLESEKRFLVISTNKGSVNAVLFVDLLH